MSEKHDQNQQGRKVSTEELCQNVVQAQFGVYRNRENYDSAMKTLNDHIKILLDVVSGQNKQIKQLSEKIKTLECTGKV